MTGDGTFAVIAGGGTAGHVLPALAVAESLVARGHDRSTIRFAGSERGMEAAMVPAAGFVLTALPVHGLERRLSPASVRVVGGYARAATRALSLLGTWRPRVMVSVGGYASAPWVAAATVWRVPIVVISYDAVPGKANRLASRVAVATAVAFDGSELPRSVITGTPLRAELLAVDRDRDRAAARAELGLGDDRFVVLVVGGSLGSGKLNEVVRDLVERSGDRGDLAIRHLIGARNDTGELVSSGGPERLVHQVVGYEERMDLAYAAADLVVGRAGSTVVAELAAVGIPSILVPWPAATEDHQRANADVLGRIGAAVVIDERELDASRLLRDIDALRTDPGRREAMTTAARSVAHRDGAERIAALIDQVARS